MKLRLLIPLLILVLVSGLVLAAAGDPTKFLNATLSPTVWVGGNAGIVNATGPGIFITLNTGQGAQEIYGWNASVFVTQGNNKGIIMTLWEGIFLAIDDYSIVTTLPYANITGHPAYDTQNQAVNTSSNVAFNNITSIDCIVFDSGGQICSGT